MKVSFLVTILFLSIINAKSQDIVTTLHQHKSFTLSDSNSNTAIYVDANEELLVRKAAGLFAEDIERVSGRKPNVVNHVPATKNLVIIGTVQSSLIQQLIRNKKFNGEKIKG